MRAHLFFALFLIALAPASAQNNSQADALFRRAERAFNKQNFREAQHYYRRAAQTNPKDPKIYEALSDVDLSLGEMDQAIQDATTALTLNPKMFYALCQRAQAYFAKNQMDKALKDVNTAMSIAPQEWEPYEIRGKIERDKKQLEAALKDSSKAIDLRVKTEGAAECVGIYRERAITLTQLGKWSSAIEDYTRAITYTTDPNKLNRMYVDRAACYEKIGRHDLAVKDMQKCNNYARTDWDVLLPK